jgi:hypothetical protein
MTPILIDIKQEKKRVFRFRTTKHGQIEVVKSSIKSWNNFCPRLERRLINLINKIT